MPRRSLVSWWHLLSLDAPTVSVTWCAAFAVTTGARIGWIVPAFLGLATWIPYVVDRLLDARFGLDPTRLRERHRFYGERLRNQRAWTLGLLALIVLGCAGIGLRMLPRAVLVGYGALSVAAVAYLGAVHLGGSAAERWLPKEAAVGLIFAIGCALPAALAIASSAWPRLVPFVALFALLCWLNCVGIERWEAAGRGLAGGHASTRWAAGVLGPLLVVAAAFSVGLALISGAGHLRALAAWLGGSFAALLVLERQHRKLPPTVSRVLADVALLTPLPWLAVWLLPGHAAR